jgi:hypothetical protein
MQEPLCEMDDEFSWSNARHLPDATAQENSQPK